jgi:quercetin dioxygenase-like cupin family protein
MRVVAEIGLLKPGKILSRTAIGLGRPLDRQISAVLVSIPPCTELPRHIHARSDDFFIILKGTGALLFQREYQEQLRSGDAVWVPAGCPHGLVSGSRGVIEVGFQCPPDKAPLSLADVRSRRSPLVRTARVSSALGAWSSLIGRRRSRIGVQVAKLQCGQTLDVPNHAAPSILLVLAGAAQVRGHALGPLSLATLDPTADCQVTATKPATLLLCVAPRTRASNEALQQTGPASRLSEV